MPKENPGTVQTYKDLILKELNLAKKESTSYSCQ